MNISMSISDTASVFFTAVDLAFLTQIHHPVSHFDKKINRMNIPVEGGGGVWCVRNLEWQNLVRGIFGTNA